VNRVFHRFARATALAAGSSWAFVLSVVVIVIWGATGPFLHWSDTWQLIANTATTIITFWMVFVVQHTQNVDTAELKALLREIAEDLPEVDDARARARIEAEAG
jgi:low affinity Fe/Cu permease